MPHTELIKKETKTSLNLWNMDSLGVCNMKAKF